MTQFEMDIYKYLKSYDGWCISLRNLKGIFQYNPQGLNDAIDTFVSKGILRPCPGAKRKVYVVNVNGLDQVKKR